MNARNQSLDVLRGIAVLMVVIYHYRFAGVPNTSLGWAGVDLFFVLSGFLVSELLFREFQSTGKLHIGRFLLRRGFKIWPAFYFYLLITALLSAMAATVLPWRVFLHSALFLRNYYPSDPIIFGHTWSLAVEEHFYILLALLFMVLVSRRRFSAIPAIWAGLIVGCLLLRIGSGNVVATHCRIDALFTGVTLRYVYNYKRAWFDNLSRWFALPIGIGCAIPGLFLPLKSSFFMQTFGLTMLSVGFALILAWAFERSPQRKGSIMMARALAFVGIYSYSIYLWQFTAGFFAEALIPVRVRFPAYVLFAIFGGIAAAKLVELPALRLRDKLVPRERPQSTKDTSTYEAPRPALA